VIKSTLLIYVLGLNGGVSVQHLEYPTAEACTAAATEVRRDLGAELKPADWRHGYYAAVCVDGRSTHF
jgi:hypothetical protein